MSMKSTLTASGWETRLVQDADRDQLLMTGYSDMHGYRRVAALGNAPDIDAAPADVWTGGGLYSWMTGATSLELVSDSIQDSPAGTGARSTFFNFLDTEYGEFAQTIIPNGTTPVPVPQQAFRIQNGGVNGAGSNGTNVGNLILRDAGGGTVRAIIPAGYGFTRQSQFTVPLGHTLQITDGPFLGINSPTSIRDATVATFFRFPEGYFRMPLEIPFSGSSPYRHGGLPGIPLAEKTDFGLRCTYISATNTNLSAGWLGTLKRNSV